MERDLRSPLALPRVVSGELRTRAPAKAGLKVTFCSTKRPCQREGHGEARKVGQDQAFVAQAPADIPLWKTTSSTRFTCPLDGPYAAKPGASPLPSHQAAN